MSSLTISIRVCGASQPSDATVGVDAHVGRARGTPHRELPVRDERAREMVGVGRREVVDGARRVIGRNEVGNALARQLADTLGDDRAQCLARLTVGRHAADPTVSPAPLDASPHARARTVCSAHGHRRASRPRARARRPRRRDHDGSLSRGRSRRHDQARSHASERGRSGGRARDPRAAGEHRPVTRCSARSSAPIPARPPTRSSGGSSIRSTAPRATCGAFRSGRTLIGLEHAGELVLGVASAPALERTLVGGARARRVPRRRSDLGVGRLCDRRRADFLLVGHARALRGRRDRRQDDGARAPVLALAWCR